MFTDFCFSVNMEMFRQNKPEYNINDPLGVITMEIGRMKKDSDDQNGEMNEVPGMFGIEEQKKEFVNCGYGLRIQCSSPDHAAIIKAEYNLSQ
jgi:hypothetical protein